MRTVITPVIARATVLQTLRISFTSIYTVTVALTNITITCSNSTSSNNNNNIRLNSCIPFIISIISNTTI